MQQEDKQQLDTLRHSAAHVLAYAVKKLFPKTKLGIGPSIRDGFYYDFDREEPFTADELAKIEGAMASIIKEDHPFVSEELAKAEALKLFEKRKEPFKCELINELPFERVSIYKCGEFIDLCKGPHVKSTGVIGAFKLLNVAGAYWKGSERNPMLQRIYGTAFFTKAELDKYLLILEEARKRDHRKLGKQLDLFSFHDEAPGFPFYHPKGMVIVNELFKYIREELDRDGYVEVKTPIILRDELWKRSGHYEHYKENMYFTKMEGAQFAVKPMNCPGGLLIYKESQHSYRDLPLKMAEMGLVHRHELSGVLHGLFRVKAFVQDDAHIFCTEDQMQEEISRCIQLIFRIYKTFGFDNVEIELSTRPEDSMGSDEIWERATAALRNALSANNITCEENPGGGAFYGPKIDFHIEDSLGRTWQCGTIQLDFSMPERFELEYTGADGQPHRPVMIHRACFGSLERFLGILIEHFGGAFPVWLAPVEVELITVSEKFEAFAKTVHERLHKEGIRAELDLRPEKIGYKIREAETLKVPYMAVIGSEEESSGELAIRGYGRKDLGKMKIEDFIKKVKSEISNRVL